MVDTEELISRINEALFNSTDQHKYVQWGYGWMLKEATKHYQGEVFEYVMRKKAVMPRSALRYAIEKMPTELKAEAMKK